MTVIFFILITAKISLVQRNFISGTARTTFDHVKSFFFFFSTNAEYNYTEFHEADLP